MKETLNLLPGEVSAIQAPPKGRLYYVIISVFLYLVVISGLWLLNAGQYRNIQAEIQTLSRIRSELQASIAAAPKPAADVAIPVEKEILNKLERTPQWSRIISEISVIVPEDVRLSSIEANQDNEHIGFKGYSVTQMGIASFIASLEKSNLLKNVEIVYSQKGDKEVSFELKAKLKWT